MATNCVLRSAPLQRDKVGDLMANNLLMLIKLDADTMAFASLLVSIVAALAAIFAAFCANTAAFYAKKAATKRDLTQVEQNTQHLEHVSNKILSIDTQVQPQPQAHRAGSGAGGQGSPARCPGGRGGAVQVL